MRSRSSSVHCTALAFNVKSGPWTVQAVPVAWRTEAVIGLMCLCLVSPHADAHTHEECGPVQTVPFIPDLAYTAVLSGSSLLSTRPGWFTRAAEVGLADMSSHRCLTDVQVLALSPARWSCSKKPLPKKIVAPCLRLAR